MTVWKERKGHYEGQWTYKFKHQGRQFCKRGFRTKPEAQRAEREKREELENPPVPENPQTCMTFAGICGKYLDFCRGRMQQNTVRQKAYVASHLIGYLQADPAVDSISKDSIIGWLASVRTEKNAKTANRYLRDMKACFNWCVRAEVIKENPFRNIAGYPEDQFEKYVPPLIDFKKVLVAATGEERDILYLFFHTGARKGELLQRLRWADVNFQERWIVLKTRKRKGGELTARRIGMNDTVYGILDRLRKKSDPEDEMVFNISREWKKRMMKRLCRAAGVRFFTFHAIRHLGASLLDDAVSIREIQAFLGHQRRTTTETYLHDLTGSSGVGTALEEVLNGKMETTEKERRRR